MIANVYCIFPPIKFMKLFRTIVIYRLLLNVRKSFALICRVTSLFVVGRNFWTSYITVIVCNSLL